MRDTESVLEVLDLGGLVEEVLENPWQSESNPGRF